MVPSVLCNYVAPAFSWSSCWCVWICRVPSGCPRTSASPPPWHHARRRSAHSAKIKQALWMRMPSPSPPKNIIRSMTDLNKKFALDELLLTCIRCSIRFPAWVSPSSSLPCKMLLVLVCILSKQNDSGRNQDENRRGLTRICLQQADVGMSVEYRYDLTVPKNLSMYTLEYR